MFFRETLLKETEGVGGGQRGGFQEIKTFGKLKELFPILTGREKWQGEELREKKIEDGEMKKDTS